MCSEAAKIARRDDAILKIGYLRSHNSQRSIRHWRNFRKYPRVDLQLLYGNHEELFNLLRTGGADLVLNDQRRAFSDEYGNLILATNKMYIELATSKPCGRTFFCYSTVTQKHSLVSWWRPKNSKLLKKSSTKLLLEFRVKSSMQKIWRRRA